MSTGEERKKLAAEQYLAENRVRWLLEHVTADLARIAPTAPHDFIARRIREIRGDGRLSVHRHSLVCVLGGPASGMGLACAHLAREMGAVTLAPSELLRNEIKDGTEAGRRVGDMLHAGQPVPTEVVAQLIEKKLQEARGAPEDAPTYALDGFPRTLEQALYLEQHVAEVSTLIYLRASDATLRARMQARAATASAQDDDSEPHRSERLQFFALKTRPVVEYYRALGKLVEVDAEQPVLEVLRLVERAARK